jgi:hypothetical protein
MATSTGQWVTSEEVAAYLGSDAPADTDQEGQQRLENAITSASDLLYSLSGRKFPGVFEAVVRPQPVIGRGIGLPAPLPPMPMGSWGSCFGPPHIRCEAPMAIGLGRAPLVEIIEVSVNGEVIDPIQYRIDDQKWLVRADCCPWPMCGCSCDNFMVQFTFGENPPQLGADAALILSAEMYRAMTPGATNCRLPARLTSITRQGVSMALIDPMDFMEKGLTGIYQVDMFITAFNPGTQIKKPMVWSPDVVNTGRRPTWP